MCSEWFKHWGQLYVVKQTAVEWKCNRLQTCRSAVQILAGRLLFVAPPPMSADQDFNRRPKNPRPAALPFDRSLF